MSENMYDQFAKDPLTKERGMCLNTKGHGDVKRCMKELEECTKRVTSKSFTAETCHQEMVDLVHAIDHCVDDKAFAKLV